MKAKVSESELVAKRLKERIRLCDINMDGEMIYGDLHRYEGYLKKVLQEILKGGEPVRTDGDRELGMSW